jgi:hypothetical protein
MLILNLMKHFIIIKKEIIVSLFVFSVSLIIFYNIYSYKFVMLSPNEIMYMGNLFKSSSIYSAYFGYDSGFGQYYFYENFIKFFVNIFPSYFYLILNIFIASFYILGFMKIFKVFNINVYLLPLFSIIFFSERFYKNFGGLNWTEQGIAEPRQIGWLLLIFSLAYFYEKKFYLSIFYLTITSYFYFVIILLLIPLFLVLIIKFKVHFKFLVIYSMLVSPFLIFLYGENATSDSLENSLKIYIVERHPHHLYPFENGILRNEWYPSLKIFLFLLVISFLLIFLLRLNKNSSTKELAYLVILLLTLLSTYLVFTYFFPINKFILLMPIRIYNLLYFILIVSLFSLLSTVLSKGVINLILIGSLVPLVSINSFFIDTRSFLMGNYSSEIQVLRDGEKSIRQLEVNNIDTSHLELINFIRKSLDENDILLIKDENYLTTSIEITTGINTYVLDKVVPKSLEEVLEWKNRKYNRGDSINNCKNLIDLDFDILILSINSDDDNECGNKIFTNEIYTISKLD